MSSIRGVNLLKASIKYGDSNWKMPKETASPKQQELTDRSYLSGA